MGDRWRAFHRPVRVGPFWIGPPWETPPRGVVPVVIDPGRAFGTGAHPTTQLCIELVAELEPAGFVDIGCGSGVISIAAALLGFDPVTALDVDPAAVDATLRNAAANGVALDVHELDAMAETVPSAHVVAANVSLPIVEALLARLDAPLVVASGYSRATSPASAGTCGATGARSAAGPQTCSSPRSRVPVRWRASTSASSAARCRTSTRRACASACSPTVTSKEKGTSRSSTRARSRTRPCRSRARQPRAPRARTGASTSRAAPPTSRATPSPGFPDNVVVVARRSEETPAFVAGDVGAIGCVQADARIERVRAFVKIQDGCSFNCNFCVIPLVRGGTRSRSADAVLQEIRRRVAQGHREIVLTGVNLGCFRDSGTTLPQLIRRAGETPGLVRLRLSSIEINHVTNELIAALRETPTAARHLHVPLQSGDDGVLRAMGRRYTVANYLRKLEGLTDFNLTGDVIVGFPARTSARSPTR